MDRNQGRLDMLSEEEARRELKGRNSEELDHFFKQGEEVILKGSLFKIQNVTPKGLRLKVLRRAAG